MPLISTANVACGYHGGDPTIMRTTIQMARKYNVAVGAHPGLPDLMGFGRRVMSVSANDLHAYIIYQVGALKGFLDAEAMPLAHVKPHGAMFYVLRDPVLADAAVDAIAAVAPGVPIILAGPIGKEVFSSRAVARGVPVWPETYPDLDYSDDGAVLVEREKKAVAPARVYERVAEVIENKTFTNSSGKVLPMDVESFCVHSDGPNVLDVITAARRAITDLGQTVGTKALNHQGA
jgi:UPF0271 protein